MEANRLNNALGFFDPISLGLHLPKLDSKYSDDYELIKQGTFIHELTHYLQFYGTTFGFSYLFHIFISTAYFIKVIRQLGKDIKLQLPVAYNYPINVDIIFPDEKEQSFFNQIIHSDRYYREELYGWSYPYLLPEPIRDKSGKIEINSNLRLLEKDGSIHSSTGESILENHASSNENLFIKLAYPDKAERIINSVLEKLDSKTYSKYHSINHWLTIFEILHLSNIIYFIILNQPQEDIIKKRGDYNLVRSLKTILNKYDKLKNIATPQNERELIDTIVFICSETGLDNPFVCLETLLENLNKLNNVDDPGTVEWITFKTVTWILSNKTLALLWPQHPMDLLTSMPLMNIFMEGDNSPSCLNLGLKENSDLHKHLSSSVVRYLVYSIMENNTVLCPAWHYTNPNICEQCKKCRGILPIENQNDCPFVKALKDLEISNIKWS